VADAGEGARLNLGGRFAAGKLLHLRWWQGMCGYARDAPVRRAGAPILADV